MAAIGDFCWKLVEAGSSKQIPKVVRMVYCLPKGIIMFYVINVTFNPLKLSWSEDDSFPFNIMVVFYL